MDETDVVSRKPVLARSHKSMSFDLSSVGCECDQVEAQNELRFAAKPRAKKAGERTASSLSGYRFSAQADRLRQNTGIVGTKIRLKTNIQRRIARPSDFVNVGSGLMTTTLVEYFHF